jgi:glycosyltransferase involved in cell wall biosynthesis
MNTKKKILFLVTQSEFGGAQRFIYRLVTNLDLSKYEISIAAGPEGNDADGLLFTLEKEGFKTFSLKFLTRNINPLFDLKLGLIEIYFLIKKIKPDILFLCSSKAGAMGSFIGRIAGVKKIIYRLGGWTFNDPWPSWKKKLYIFLEKKTARFKDIIINNAELDKQQAIKLGINPRDRIIIIYNGIDADKLELLSREEARNLLNISAGFVVGTIANFYPVKGLEYLIKAADLIKDSNVKFIIIGEGRERKKLENLIKKYNLENRFFLPGAMPEAYKYLKAFDIFVLPSVKEGFPWTILESMAAEIPIIATRVGAIPEILEDKKNGILIDPKDVIKLAEAIQLLIKNKNLRETMTMEAKKTVREKFNLETMIKKYEDLLSIN